MHEDCLPRRLPGAGYQHDLSWYLRECPRFTRRQQRRRVEQNQPMRVGTGQSRRHVRMRALATSSATFSTRELAGRISSPR